MSGVIAKYMYIPSMSTVEIRKSRDILVIAITAEPNKDD
jgi:hypothetical protein